MFKKYIFYFFLIIYIRYISFKLIIGKFHCTDFTNRTFFKLHRAITSTALYGVTSTEHMLIKFYVMATVGVVQYRTPLLL